MKMNKYSYKLTVISPVILSPRDSMAIYLSKDEKAALKEKNGIACNIIYPFYQYGEYLEYSPENTEYYIPGSSIKGSLLAGNTLPIERVLMVDDIPVKADKLELIISTHAESLNFLKPENTKLEGKHPSFAKFFENVGLESLKIDSVIEGVLQSNFDIAEIVNFAGERAKNRTEEYIRQLLEIEKRADGSEYSDKGKEDFTRTLDTVIENLKHLQEKTNLLFLGGHKGLLRSLTEGSAIELLWRSGIYFDDKSYLPFGIVEIEYKKESSA